MMFLPIVFVQGFDLITGFQFFKYILKVLFNGFRTDVQALRNGFVWKALLNQYHDFFFAWSKDGFFFQSIGALKL
jgi:hypothetical protein